MDTRKHIVNLEAFREMLHISPRVPSQSFAELPFEEEILEFLRDDILFSTIKVVSRHQNTQQYDAILPIELTTEDLRNTKAYKEYYTCATGEAAPKPKASARRKKGGSASSTTPPTPIATPTPITTVVAAPRLTAAAKGKQPAKATSPTDPSDQGGFSTDKGTGSKPGVSDVPSDDSDEEISWNSFDDEAVDAQGKNRDDDKGNKNDESNDGQDDDDDDYDDEEEIAKIDEPKDTESGRDDEETESDGESEEEETTKKEEEGFDLIPRTPEKSEDDGNGEEDQGLRISEEERMHEKEEADELYRMKSIFTTGSSSVTPMPSPKSTMTPSIFTTTTTASQPPIPPTPILTDLSEMEMKKILIDKIEGNKSIQRSDEQRNLYKALVDAYEADKTILDSYGESAILKKRRRSTTGTQSRQMSASESAFAEEPVQTTCQMEEPSHPVFETGAEDQPIVQTSQHPEWFSQPRKPPTPDHDWNKTLPAVQRNAHSWIRDESYQKRLNLTKPDTYRSDLKRREVYTAYSNPRGFIYQNKDKKNRLMRIDELQKFSDGTLNDVRNALDDRLKGIRIQYLPTIIWRKGDCYLRSTR
nr:hypothetical protein [Tanacetum cinerariifolium]